MKHKNVVLSAALLLSLTLGAAQADTVFPAEEPASATLIAAERFDVRDNLIGTWHRSEVARADCANLCITKGKDPNTLYVRLRAFHGANEGLVTGNAVLTDGDGYGAKMIVKSNGHQGAIELVMGQMGMSVEYSGSPEALGVGHGVKVSGLYVKGMPNYIGSVAPQRAFLNQANFNRATKVIGEKNMLNLFDMLNNSVVTEDEPGKFAGHIPGSGMNIQIRATQDGLIYVYGENVFAGPKEQMFFTNDKNYATELPAWLEFYGDAKDVHIVCK